MCFTIACTVVAGDFRRALPLLLWLGSGLVALPYVHMAAKYLLPGVPAAALLIVLHAARVNQQRYPLTVSILVALGWISGALIIFGDTALATSQREAVNRIVAPRLRRGIQCGRRPVDLPCLCRGRRGKALQTRRPSSRR
jgi:hypothetical protein